jgi:hypothetical protein
MSTPEDQLSHEHSDSTYAVATPDPEHIDDKMTNPPSGPAVEQTRGVPTDSGAGATRSADREEPAATSKTAVKKP